jgi:hypothetical protein
MCRIVVSTNRSLGRLACDIIRPYFLLLGPCFCEGACGQKYLLWKMLRQKNAERKIKKVVDRLRFIGFH